MSKIEWTDRTINFTTGCNPISPGCKNCYAARMHRRLRAMGLEKYKKPFNKIVMHWDYLEQITNELYEPYSPKKKKRNKIFINSMSDLFHKKITDQFIYQVLCLCDICPQYTFQILTKRAERLKDFDYPPNVWLGVTVENYLQTDRIRQLLQTNAKVKFISCEPLLSNILFAEGHEAFNFNELQWVIAGGETGPGKREIRKRWVTDIRDACVREEVPFFFKQWSNKGDNLIDGKLWQQFPEVLGKGVEII